jgi:hypothetical protein
MNIFTIRKKGKDNLIEVFFWNVKPIFCAVERSKGFSNTPERGNDSLQSACLLKEHIDQIRTCFGVVTLNPCAGVKIEIMQKGLLLSHVKYIITEFMGRIYIIVKYLSGFGNRCLFYMEGGFEFC